MAFPSLEAESEAEVSSLNSVLQRHFGLLQLTVYQGFLLRMERTPPVLSDDYQLKLR